MAERASAGRGRVSMAEVAARAGVSGQTVSRVVNGSPRVDPATRARVESAMAELGYRPHRAARALRTGRSRTIGLVVTTLATVGNSRMLQATAEAAAERGYALTVVTAADGIAAAFTQLGEQGVDGAVVLNEASALVPAAQRPDGLHLVIVDADSEGDLPTVHSDHAGGAAAATAHLLDRGHRTVHHLAGPADSFAAAERERGWRETLVTAGIRPPEPVRGDWTSGSGHAAGGGLSAATAVFCANDQMALGLVRALAATGRRVPADVSVVGFDDVPEAADYLPPLTTIRQDFTQLGQRAVSALVASIEGATVAAPSSAVVPTALVLRESTAPPPAPA
ncbi:LacI family DNA-binding transcriptional regulator [Microbacterium sp. p3-SID336]|uniref:LacI family DNA-binding transcriptional regulator n=1 Tax=Microbacterium sp. p3-SID336 TaxID=2916212 RepID=UPI0021A81352|nr:LacI family DNA-binding transcriptional regulator [Microbacterium sp. p3-SID336]MCT1476850.1 LacI family transcriptional regulator [Microbacterium sp. p3-SID336]